MYVYTTSLYIHLLMDGDAASILTIVNNAAMDIGEGNGTPLQYSCLENPMDGGA